MPFNPREIAFDKRVEWKPRGSNRTASVLAIVQSLRRQYPAGVDAIIVGRAGTPGWMELERPPHRGTAILIGLLPAAVQKLRAPRDTDRILLRSALGTSGRIGVIVADPIDSGSMAPPRITWEV